MKYITRIEARNELTKTTKRIKEIKSKNAFILCEEKKTKRFAQGEEMIKVNGNYELNYNLYEFNRERFNTLKNQIEELQVLEHNKEEYKDLLSGGTYNKIREDLHYKYENIELIEEEQELIKEKQEAREKAREYLNKLNRVANGKWELEREKAIPILYKRIVKYQEINANSLNRLLVKDMDKVKELLINYLVKEQKQELEKQFNKSMEQIKEWKENK